MTNPFFLFAATLVLMGAGAKSVLSQPSGGDPTCDCAPTGSVTWYSNCIGPSYSFDPIGGAGGCSADCLTVMGQCDNDNVIAFTLSANESIAVYLDEDHTVFVTCLKAGSEEWGCEVDKCGKTSIRYLLYFESANCGGSPVCEGDLKCGCNACDAPIGE